MAGASNLQNRRTADRFQPMWADEANPQAYTPLTLLGINVVTATLLANTAQVNAVAHSLGVAPATWSAVQLNASATSKVWGLVAQEASAPNNSVVGIFVTGYSVGDPVSAPFRITFLPPARA